MDRMNRSSSLPAHSSVSTTAVVGGSTSNVALSAYYFQFSSDLISIQDPKEEAMLGDRSLPPSASSSPRSPWVSPTSVEGSRSSIAGPNPLINRRLRVGILNQFVSWSRQSAIQTPPSRLPTTSVSTGDLCGGARIIDWRPQPTNRLGASLEFPIDSVAGASNQPPRPLL
ncbi:hypothetical protein CRG98_033906 [Punica granatum]|uniref:Uncharacterized protein n=1 Tax=Punica granatum TaxID=22663 RepID=A0A2I0IPH4_PUNGR|nr:hypothetical protein CRG98_033906 [Punica granatum]